jgi:hypothetical protein
LVPAGGEAWNSLEEEKFFFKQIHWLAMRSAF